MNPSRLFALTDFHSPISQRKGVHTSDWKPSRHENYMIFPNPYLGYRQDREPGQDADILAHIPSSAIVVPYLC